MADKAKSYYFPHDSNARNDHKIALLRLNMGWEGYGLYWATLEIMREHNQGKDRYKIPANLAARLLSLQLNIDETTAQTFITTAKAAQLFQEENDFIFSASFLERMRKIDKRASKSSSNGRLGGRPKKPKQNLVGLQNESKTKAIKQKEKEKKTKENTESALAEIETELVLKTLGVGNELRVHNWLKDHPRSEVIYAIEKSAGKANPAAYAEGILQSRRRDGYPEENGQAPMPWEVDDEE